MSALGVTGWERLRHGGLLLDAQRLKQIGGFEPEPLTPFLERELRRQALSIIDGSGDVPAFVTFVVKDLCGFSESAGRWQRGSNVSTEWGRVGITGETIKPRQLWQGSEGGVLPVFFDGEKRIGVGRGKRATSQVLQWLRAGQEKLALITNGQQWRLIFAGLDFDAWCEWDLDLWFEEGELSSQVVALRTLFSPTLWTPTEKDERPPLLQAIQDSRKGQAELSAVLGERVREAVELVVQGHGDVLKDRCSDVDPAEIYRAAVRMVMRLVVVLFAESRELLPRDNALYHGSYGVTGLLEELEKIAARGGNRLARSWNAWPRVLSLFRLVHQGSHHPDLTITAYGGELFAPGEAASTDGLSRALSVFENVCYERELMSDRDVHRALELITRTRIKLRQGRSSTWVPAPVDFSDLSSEYIGILYEGLLDFELRTAPSGDPVIFLAVGNQPALPLSRLEAMDDKALANLLDKMKDTSSRDEEPGEQSAEIEETLQQEEDPDENELAEEREEQPPEDSSVQEEVSDERHTTRTRAEQWARRAVEAGNVVPRPRGLLTPERRLAHEEAVGQKARQLVTRVMLPGEWYLVRWGGTRKGGGTFYTRPGLAVPTVQRTLRPLAYTAPIGADSSTSRDAPAAEWIPKLPEEILALKVCDPACGSGSFPVAALRFLTDALYKSLHSHDRLNEDWRRPLDELLGLVPEGGLDEELKLQRLPCAPEDGEFEQRTKAVLRRYVVERCIYGVDLDPLAVELCRLALWIETMDRTLPFSFIDHKIKCGNALVGAWFDQFQHYPVMAWKNREGGDKNHSNGAHFEKEERTKAIKAFVKETLSPDLKQLLQGRTLFNTDDLLEQARNVHDDALNVLMRLHELPMQDSAERARMYREELLGSDTYKSLKSAMNLWSSCWFWPTETLEAAPLPTTFHEPAVETRELASLLATRKRFFHWELEFPTVFQARGSGFDAVIGNPPWEIAKPNSKEFFSNIDPLYRSYGKQEAIRYQTDYFNNQNDERNWLDYNAEFRAQSNFIKYSANAYGDPTINEESVDRFSLSRGKDNEILHGRWRQARQKSITFSDKDHPFRHQGSADINLYKLFLEQGHNILREGGRLGFIVPSGLYSDYGTGGIRSLFLERCSWEWLFSFENREKIFNIHRSYKFNPVIIEKGGKTAAILTAFMRRNLEDWEHAAGLATPYTLEQVSQFSPRSKAILEIQSARDLEILEKIHSHSVLLGDRGTDSWGIKYSTEFHMTADSKLFPPRTKWKEQGYRPDEYSRWLKGNWRPIEELWAEMGVRPLRNGEHRCAQPPYDTLPIPRADIPPSVILSREADAFVKEQSIDDTAFPLYEGRMIGQFDFSEKGWVSGRGRGAVWEEISWAQKIIEPQYLMGFKVLETEILDQYLEAIKERDGDEAAEHERSRLDDPEVWARWELRNIFSTKTPIMNISSATNARTAIGCFSHTAPCNHALNPARHKNLESALAFLGSFDSFAFDYIIRLRLAGLNVSFFVLDETLVPKVNIIESTFITLIARLSMCSPWFSKEWLRLTNICCPESRSLRGSWALTMSERLRLRCISDAVVFAYFGLDPTDISHILADVDRPAATTNNTNAKGFWRVDDDLEPELRQTILTIVAFDDLAERIRQCNGDRNQGFASFMTQNDGEGWILPETLRLADYDLGHDERAKEHQPVAKRLGPRFYEWQLAQSVEESWRECHLHARNLLGDSGYRQLLADIQESEGEQQSPETAKTPTIISESDSQPMLGGFNEEGHA